MKCTKGLLVADTAKVNFLAKAFLIFLGGDLEWGVGGELSIYFTMKLQAGNGQTIYCCAGFKTSHECHLLWQNHCENGWVTS